MRNIKPSIDPKQDIVLQITSWYSNDEEYDDDEEDEHTNMDSSKYLVKVFGVTEQGYSVSVNLTDFPPFFYIKSPVPLNDFDVRMLKDFVVGKLPYRLKNGLKDIKVMHKKDFWGFTNNQKFIFVRLSFKNIQTFRAAFRMFQRKVVIDGIRNYPLTFKLYENNIDPFLRLAHIQNIDPAGWVKVKANQYEINTDIKPTRCQIDITCRWSSMVLVNIEKMAPILIGSFDLECTSSHGDFPVPEKDYRKIAVELCNNYHPDMTKDQLYNELILIFDHSQGGMLSKVYPKQPGAFKETQVKKVIDDVLINLQGRSNYKKPTNTSDLGKMEYKEPTPMTKDDKVKNINEVLSKILPALQGDPIIQIGTTLHSYGDNDCSYKHIITLNTCDDIPGAVVEQCATERDMLLRWRQLIIDLDPDILTGYNIFGFDMSYLYERAKQNNIWEIFQDIGRISDHPCQYVEKMLSSSAMGDNLLKYIDMDGRVLIDLMKVVQREHKLDSYKLDFVASFFLGGKVISSDPNTNSIIIDNIKGISPDSYVKLSSDTKYKVLTVTQVNKNYELILDQAPAVKETKWGLAKDDITPRQIFEFQNKGPMDRALIAKYCLKDCALCNYLIMKLETLANNVGMANVCSVPLSFIFMRGQGIKIFSLVAKQCREEDFLIPCLTKYQNQAEEEPTDEEGYEGAIVLDPQEGIYIDSPISVLDYASLYPSSMISENLSHDCIVLDSKYDNIPGLEYLDINYDIYEIQNKKKVKTGVRTCRFVQLPEKGMIPRILMHLLKQRKLTRKKIEFQTVTTKDDQQFTGIVTDTDGTLKITALDGTSQVISAEDVVLKEDTYDDFQKAVLDGLQLAYKITANSLYGQCGARTSQIYMKDVAACTTATGRTMILKARDFIMSKPIKFNYEYEPEITYGDTDSIFVIFNLKDGLGNKIIGKSAIPIVRELSIQISKEFKKLIKQPHDLEWEKIFYPFILFSKKRYCANKYEWDDHKYKQNSMGIVLKRRDNAQIVKTIYGGILDIILNEQDIPKSISFLKQNVQDLIDGKFPLEDLIISKSLKAEYKNPDQIAHKVLADRMKGRDEGSAPQVNDRLPYVHIETPPVPKGKKVLQGDCIDHPDYIRANNLRPNYEYYITNQIMKPCLQLYALVLEDLQGYRSNTNFADVKQKLLKEKDDPKKAKDKYNDIREEEVKKLLFDPFLIKLQNKKSGTRAITEFFKPK